MLSVFPITFSNNSPSSQKQELQRVYEWFSVNKPLLRPQTNASKSRPKIAFTSRRNANTSSADKPLYLERPQTAPASFHPVRLQAADCPLIASYRPWRFWLVFSKILCPGLHLHHLSPIISSHQGGAQLPTPGTAEDQPRPSHQPMSADLSDTAWI